MQTKLTLRLDDRLIRRAKAVAKANGKSVSQLVADFFDRLSQEAPKSDTALTPTVRGLKGVLRDKNLTEEDYRSHLERKHR